MRLRAWLAEHPPPDGAFSQSLAGVARRAAAGEAFLPAVRELLDEYALLQDDGQRARALAERPPPTGDARHDAFLGALAEHLAAASGIERAGWACEPDRFLGQFWFVSEMKGFRATLLADAPAAFRRRGIFVSRRSLERC